jgi:transposase
MSNICSYYGVNANTYGKFYKKRQSEFSTWNQLSHSESYLLFPQNIGPYLSIDEVSVSKGELYTFITNKAAKGKKGTIVACIADTKAEKITEVLRKLSIEKRKQVVEVTLDMAPNMSMAVRNSFPMAQLVTDRFHVVRLGLEALQHLRTNLRWEEMEKENEKIENSKKSKDKYIPETFENGDTPKQLLARSRYILAKKESQWTENQKQRALTLFDRYPQTKIGYDHVIKLRAIYEEKHRIDAIKRLKKWIDDSRIIEIKQFLTVANSLENHFDTIINFFINRSTNANAESFNSKIKLFRANQRGVVDTKFFLFRLYKLFA